MRLHTLSVKNYRSFENSEVNFTNYVVLIGPNNAGKTSLFSLLDKILNPFRSLYNSDFELSDFRNPLAPMEVDMFFDNLDEAHVREFKFYLNQPELSDDQEVDNSALYVHLKYECRYDLDKESFSKALFVIGEEERIELSESQRKMFPFIYRSAQRDNRTELKIGRNTFLKRLVDTIQIEESAKEDIRGLLEKAADILSEQLLQISNLIEENSKHVIEYPLPSDTSKEQQHIRFNLMNVDSDKLLNNLEIYIWEAFKPQFESLTHQGLGYQNAIVLAIFKSFATSAIKGKMILALEEPELFLPPHAQRALARDFKRLSEENQIMVATHSSSFMLNAHPTDIVTLKREPDGTTGVAQFEKSATGKDLVFFAKRINAINGDAFFANVVLLVEGESEEGSMSELSFRLDPIDSKFSFDKHGVTVLNCGGKTFIKDVNRLVKFFGIKTVAMVDFDPSDDPAVDRDEGELQTISSAVDRFHQLPRYPEWGDFEGVLAKNAPIPNLIGIIVDLELQKALLGQWIVLNNSLGLGEDVQFIKDAAKGDISENTIEGVIEQIQQLKVSYMETWVRAGIRDLLGKHKSIITSRIVATHLTGEEIPDPFANVIKSCIELAQLRLKTETANE